jgi:hypothetical protein
MTADQFPKDVPLPEPYEFESPQISAAAVYRAQIDRLDALGYAFDLSVVCALQFYVAFSRAVNELEQLRAKRSV